MVQLIGAFENNVYHLVVLEFCEGITLFQLVELNTFLPESIARVISKQVTFSINHSRALIYDQVFSALSYLNSLNIVHGDIKDENLMVARLVMCSK